MKNTIVSYERCRNGIVLKTLEHSCKIVFLTDKIIRVKYCFAPDISLDRSYAVLLCDQNPDETLYGYEEKTIVKEILPDVTEDQEHISLTVQGTGIKINKENICVAIVDKDHKTVHRDISGRAYYTDENSRRYHYFAQEDYDKYYGFGERTGTLNKYKKSLRMYSNDTLGYDAEKADPLYKHIPFFIKLNKSNTSAVGVFYDSTGAGVFDMGCEHSNYWERYAKFCCDSGDIDYYVILGKEMKEVVRGYTDLTGKTILPTYASLGYMASTMYYTESDKDSDKGIGNFLEELEAQGLPCDGFHLSSGYTSIGSKRYVFNWNYDRFPEPNRFIEFMNRKKVSVSPNIKPALLTDHPLYKEFAEAGGFIADEKTGGPYLERYWGGMGSFVDFSSPKGRGMWKKYLKKQLIDIGITDFWDDNNEYEFFSQDAQCYFDHQPIKAHRIKPVFANLMAKTAIDALKEQDDRIRPYILSRAGYAGIQRYAQTWAGDNHTCWNSLKYNIATMLGMGLSGVANQGCDVGGFHGPAPDAELFVRWVQNGIFQPRFCIHSCNNDNTVTQPWSYGEAYTGLIRDAFRLRYSMGLYLYSLFFNASRLGDPVMRPMVYEFQQDANMAENSFDFMFGPYLLVANVLEQGACTRDVRLPDGCDWYDFYTHKKYTGGQLIIVDAPLDKIPLFYRSGTILPLIEPSQHMEIENIENTKLLIEPSANSSFILYQDDGKTTDYKKGESLTTCIIVENQDRDILISFVKSGFFKDKIKSIHMRVICKFDGPLSVMIGEQALLGCINKSEFDTNEYAWYFDIQTRHVEIKYPNRPGDYSVAINFKIKDLIGM